MKLSLTYKKDPRETGLASVTQKEGYDIKLNKVSIGRIHEKSHFDNSDSLPFSIQICVQKTSEELLKEPNCLWRWMFIANRFNTADEAKQWLSTNIQSIYDLYIIFDNESRQPIKSVTALIRHNGTDNRSDQVKHYMNQGVTSANEIASILGTNINYVRRLMK